MPRVRYQQTVSEVFGYSANADKDSARRARTDYACPFVGGLCGKRSTHRDFDRYIPFGACSVWFRGSFMEKPAPHIICPVRFVQNSQIFHDVSRLHERIVGTQTIVIPESGLGVGRFDYMLALVEPDRQELIQPIALEVMASSTTSTGKVLRSFHNALHGEATSESYGINYRQVVSRMMIQVLAKAYACEAWGLQMVWAIQDTLLGYMQATTQVELEEIAVTDLETQGRTIPILFFVYALEQRPESEQFVLGLQRVFGASKEGIAKFLVPEQIPERHQMIAHLKQRAETSPTVFRLGTSLPTSLALEVAEPEDGAEDT